MNIIEAIKSGKDFRRKSWHDKKFFVYLGLRNRFIVRELDMEINNGCGFYSWELIADDWEVKEPENNIVENKFDPTKPVQTRGGKNARIICTDRKGGQPIIALYEFRDDYEECGKFSINGKFYGLNDRESSCDLINIPEPKPIDVHLGGVYKSKDDGIAVFTIDGFVLLEFKEDFSPFFINEEEIVEHLGDIQDLNTYIKEILK